MEDLNVRDIEIIINNNNTDNFLRIINSIMLSIISTNRDVVSYYWPPIEMKNRLKNHFLEKGFSTYTTEERLYISVGDRKSICYIMDVEIHTKRIKEKDLLYVVFRRFKHLKLFDWNIFKIVKIFL